MYIFCLRTRRDRQLAGFIYISHNSLLYVHSYAHSLIYNRRHSRGELYV